MMRDVIWRDNAVTYDTSLCGVSIPYSAGCRQPQLDYQGKGSVGWAHPMKEAKT